MKKLPNYHILPYTHSQETNMLINLKKKPQIIRKNAERCREKGIVLPTFAEMKDPSLIPQDIKDRLRNVGLWDVNPLNLYRIKQDQLA